MMTGESSLETLFQSAVGPDNVTANSQMVIDGLRPALLVRAGSKQEVAECLRICSASDIAAIPAGHMTWLECGNPLQRADIVLCVGRMDRVIDYSPADLTIAVEAGLGLAELNTILRSENQWLPLDPPGSYKATIGAVAACASSGPLRPEFGTPRDYCIGLSLAHADGSESKSGGRVVKNVAGYDMNKLYVGSFGTLAVLTELTLKLRPLPECSATIVACSEQCGTLFEIAGELLGSGLRPASLCVANARFSEVLQNGPETCVLLIRFVETEALVKFQAEKASAILGNRLDQGGAYRLVAEDAAEKLWGQIADLDTHAANTFKISVPVSRTRDAFDAVTRKIPACMATAEIATGILRIAFDADDGDTVTFATELRNAARHLGGSLTIERAAPAVRSGADAWGEAGPAAETMRAIKSKFDPAFLLNRGRFVSGI
jgi:glycolate oxidase FAD binding subunit